MSAPPSITYSGAPLTRHSSLNPDQFSTHWLQNHAPIVTPYFLASGTILEYIQIHLPELNDRIDSCESQKLLEPFDGVAFLRRKKQTSKMSARLAQEYYESVILKDERRFLDEGSGSAPVKKEGVEGPKRDAREWRDLALEVGGREFVIIENGKAVWDIGEGAWEEWRRWEGRLGK